MTQINLEGVDFGKDYSVYATDFDKVYSLESLNPSYMAKLLDVPSKVNTEIIDNNLYLHNIDL